MRASPFQNDCHAPLFRFRKRFQRISRPSDAHVGGTKIPRRKTVIHTAHQVVRVIDSPDERRQFSPDAKYCFRRHEGNDFVPRNAVLPRLALRKRGYEFFKAIALHEFAPEVKRMKFAGD